MKLNHIKFLINKILKITFMSHEIEDLIANFEDKFDT